MPRGGFTRATSAPRTRRATGLSAADVVAFTEGKLARYKVPSQVEIVEGLPRNAQGKILKRILRDQLRSVPAAREP